MAFRKRIPTLANILNILVQVVISYPAMKFLGNAERKEERGQQRGERNAEEKERYGKRRGRKLMNAIQQFYVDWRL